MANWHLRLALASLASLLYPSVCCSLTEHLDELDQMFNLLVDGGGGGHGCEGRGRGEWEERRIC